VQAPKQDGEGPAQLEAGGNWAPSARPSSQDVVRQALRWEIGVGTWAPGELLPSERELSDRFGVGRATLRAALDELRSSGLVTTARGRHGGTRVAEGPPEKTRLSPGELVQARENLCDNFRFRRAVESAAAEQAAVNATASQLELIHKLLLTPVSGVRGYRAIDSQFHIAVAAASGSRLLRQSVEQARFELFTWADSLWLAEPDWASLPVQYRDFALTHHSIATALGARDPEAAKAAVVEHLNDGEKSYLELLDRMAG
jgi:GntR family transcriptional regulator, transcriptional repressor for pyruvate dehydrogenase complex